MQKRKCNCMTFVFLSLCSCSGTLLPYCPLANFAKTTASSYIASAGSICLFGPAGARSDEGTMGNCSEGVAGNCNRDGVPEWLEDFTENLEIGRSTCTRRNCRDTDPEPQRPPGFCHLDGLPVGRPQFRSFPLQPQSSSLRGSSRGIVATGRSRRRPGPEINHRR